MKESLGVVNVVPNQLQEDFGGGVFEDGLNTLHPKKLPDFLGGENRLKPQMAGGLGDSKKEG